MSTRQKVSWGILSTATIAVEQVIPAMQQGLYSDINAIASRKYDVAHKAAGDWGIPKAYGSYDALLADSDIEAIYIPLPNHMHVEWAIRVLEAGKHVLCEKPIGLSSAEAQQLLDASKQYPHLKVMEAFMYRFHPQWMRAVELVRNGRIGELKTIHSIFTFHDDNPESICNHASMGGGGLMDIGCYSISLSRLLFDSEPRRVIGMIETDPRFHVDRIASGILDFGVGTSIFTCSTQLDEYQRVNIIGTAGRIEIELPFNPSTDKPSRLWLFNDSHANEIVFDACSHYTFQGDLFSQAILNDTDVPTPLEDAVANMRVIEAIRASAEDSAWQNM